MLSQTGFMYVTKRETKSGFKQQRKCVIVGHDVWSAAEVRGGGADWHSEPPRGLARCRNIVLMTLPDHLVLQEIINSTMDSRKQEVVTYGMASALQSISRTLGQFAGAGVYPN